MCAFNLKVFFVGAEKYGSKCSSLDRKNEEEWPQFDDTLEHLCWAFCSLENKKRKSLSIALFTGRYYGDERRRHNEQVG